MKQFILILFSFFLYANSFAIDNITFSCDSIEKEGERKGFNPELFRKNIEYLKNNKPNLKIGISATNTAKKHL